MPTFSPVHTDSWTFSSASLGTFFIDYHSQYQDVWHRRGFFMETQLKPLLSFLHALKVGWNVGFHLLPVLYSSRCKKGEGWDERFPNSHLNKSGYPFQTTYLLLNYRIEGKEAFIWIIKWFNLVLIISIMLKVVKISFTIENHERC